MIELTEIQPMVLQRSDHEQVTLDFLRFGEPLAAARHRLGHLLDHTADRLARQHAGESPNATMNIGLTGAAMQLLQLNARIQDALPAEFALGMRAARARLGDPEASLSGWRAPFDTAVPVHAVLVTYSSEPLPAVVPGLLEPEDHAGRWTGRRDRANDVEAFGFRDNITDPVIEGSNRAVHPGNGIWDPRRRVWRAVRSGEAVLGYVDESGAVAGHADASRLLRNGSYLVIRRLEQHVDAFEAACAEIAKRLGIPDKPDEVAARMMGRHKDGRVIGYEDQPPEFNDFLYRDGSRSRAAPSSHIRRANPRDDMDFADRIVKRHQLFRRGVPYADGDEVGLLFMACCADIRRQFEFVQKHWLQDGNRFGLGDERDPITGQLDELELPPTTSSGDDIGSAAPDPTRRAEPEAATVEQRKISVDDDGARRQFDVGSYVTTRGGEYFLLPSVSALHLLASGGVTSKSRPEPA